MSDQNPTEETALETVNPGETQTAVAQWVEGLAASTLQWVHYAQQKVAEGDGEEAVRALATINGQVAEIQKYAELTQAVMGGLQETLKEAISQRDGLVKELEQKEVELEHRVEAAFEGGIEAAMEDLAQNQYWMDEETIDSYEQGLIDDAGWTAEMLRKAGRVEEAEALEAKAASVYQNRVEARELIDKYDDELMGEARKQLDAQRALQASVEAVDLDSDEDYDDEDFDEDSGDDTDG